MASDWLVADEIAHYAKGPRRKRTPSSPFAVSIGDAHGKHHRRVKRKFRIKNGC
jgi:hypothetical protein